MITIAGLLLSSALAIQALPFNISMSHDEQGLPKYTSGTNWWLTTCDASVFAGTYVEIMDFSQCVAWCRDLSFGEQQGETFTGLEQVFTFADIQHGDEMECVRAAMTENYDNGASGKAGHYWIGGQRNAETGSYEWLTGRPMDYTDFVNKPGNNPYLHLTPANQYRWNTKSDQNDRNNGCLCRLDTV